MGHAGNPANLPGVQHTTDMPKKIYLQMRKNEASKLLHKLMGGRTARQVVCIAIYRARVF